MTFVVSCAFYQDSKCMLKGGCCDLNCSINKEGRNIPFNDDIDPFAQWSMERIEHIEESTGQKLN